MITVVAKLQAAEGKADELQQVLTDMVRDVKANEPGVACYSLHTSNKEPGLFLFYEQYRDQASFDSHGRTDHMRTMGRAIRDRGLTAGPPQIELYTQVAGID